MATSISTARLAGFFKDRFGEYDSLLPMDGYESLQKKIKFKDSKKLGEKLTFPLRASHSSGWTFAGGSTTGTMFQLNAANSPSTVEATFTSQEFVIREQMSFKAVQAASSDAQAFADGFDDMVKDLRNSAGFALEFSIFYGGSDLGTISSTPSGSGTDRVYALTKASTSPGLWYKMQGVLFDVYTAAGGSKLNPDDHVVVVSADLDDTTGLVYLTVTGDATDLTAIDAAIATGAVMIPKGAETNWTVGIAAIANTPTTYGGITTASYPLFTGTTLSAGNAPLTFRKTLNAQKRNMLKSGPGKRTLLCSYATMADIIDSFSAISRVDAQKGGKLKLGGDSAEYEMPGGNIEFMPHVLCKEGEAYMLDFSVFDRIGSTDFTFDPYRRGQYVEPVQGYAGIEVLGYWDQGLMCRKPSSITKITNITNTD